MKEGPGEETIPEEIDDENTSLTPNQNRVINYISIHPNSYHKDIAEGLELDKGTLSKVLKYLEELNRIKQDDRGGYVVVF